ncbi:MAG TPA: HAMP domain-containing sensor histidine kinase [Chloroflexota bacterium]|nr:HAMP domain-containing sensor histidine kinase [Chloroflexota bacterium]
MLLLVLGAAAVNLLALPPGYSLSLLYAAPLFWMARRWPARPVALLGGICLLLAILGAGNKAVPEQVALLDLLGLAVAGGMAVWVARVDGAARAAGEAAHRGRDEFVAAAAHDLKNPLTAIRGQVFLLQRRAQRLVTDEASGGPPGAGMAGLVRGLTAIDGAAMRTLALLNALLDAVRLQAGELLDLQRRHTDLVALAREVVATYQAGTDRHQMEVRAEAPEVVGRWDGFRLERVLENLLSNAIKYSPSGGAITVTVGRDEGRGGGGSQTADGPWAVLVVRDEGVGIPAADVRRLFQPYQRGGNAAVASGTGIGLAGARQIVEQHGGVLTVRSVEGHGSTFMVRLPVEP